MSAEVLREAARLIRSRAEAATPGPWLCYGDHLVWPSEKGPAANDPILAMVGEAHDDCAEHIASWHPAVALAVADWLDVVLDDFDADAERTNNDYEGRMNLADYEAGWFAHHPALAVARAYLGES